MPSDTSRPELTYWLDRSPRKTPALPDTLYDDSHNFQNVNDLVAYRREFAQSRGQQRRIAQALMCASPLMPEAEIAEGMTAAGTTRDMTPHRVLTIDDMFTGAINGDTQAMDKPPSDWSATASGMAGAQVAESYPSQRPW